MYYRRILIPLGTLLVAYCSSSVNYGSKHRMLIHQIVVQFGIQTEVSVTQGTIWPSVCVCINIQERKVAV